MVVDRVNDLIVVEADVLKPGLKVEVDNMGYGVKVQKIENGRGIKVIKPKMAIAHNTSGYGIWKEKPYSARVAGKDLKHFKTKAEAEKYLKEYRKKVNKEARKHLKNF